MFEALIKHYKTVKNREITSLMKDDRFRDFSVSAGDIFIDYSKTSIDHEGRDLLIELAQERNVFDIRDSMFKGGKINTTEERAVLHTALRCPRHSQVFVDGEDIIPNVHKVLDKMSQFSDEVRSGTITSSTGQKFTDVVNIGIGGSDLGPVMAVRALAPFHDGPNIHFISNIDGADIHDTLQRLDPQTTLVLIASKTFTTIETMTNAQTAKIWLNKIPDPNQHLAAISTADEKTAAFGIDSERVFGFEDWVGGRYSLWGPIGLSIMLAIGHQNFQDFLSGAHKIDTHFQKQNGAKNAPLMLALVGIWHRNICGYATRAILPYEDRLARLPAYLQQLDMESNGKSVSQDGSKLEATGPIVWGEPGTNGQHAFYQLIHQGSDVIPCEFLIGQSGHEESLAHHHKLLKANCIAQSRALLIGRSFDEALAITQAKGFKGEEAERQARHRVFEGNRPSLTIIYPKLTPSILGQIIALYEHRVFVEGAIWGLNSFDQWGVELGKELALSLGSAFDGDMPKDLDASTQGLLEKLK